MGFWIQQGVSGFAWTRSLRDRHQGRQGQNAGRAIRHAALVPRVSAMARAAPSSAKPTRGRAFRTEYWRRRPLHPARSTSTQHLLHALPCRMAVVAKALNATRPRPAHRAMGPVPAPHDELDLGRLGAACAGVRKSSAPTTCSFTTGAWPPAGADAGRRPAPASRVAYSLMLTLPKIPRAYGDERHGRTISSRAALMVQLRRTTVDRTECRFH